MQFDNIRGSGTLYLDVMKIICGDTHDKSMVDLGCHHAPYTPLLGFSFRTYVDIQNRPLDNQGEQEYFIQADIISYLNICNRHFDVSIASDTIEHLSESNGTHLMHLMEWRSEKQIIFTPLGEYMLDKDSEHPDSHVSAWTPDMLPDYLSIIFPDFHPSLGVGAFFAVNCADHEKIRIHKELKNKYE